MSQEFLFLLFMIAEGIFLIALYQLYLVPRVISPAVVNHWLEEIESGRIDLPQVLESYTGEIMRNIDGLLFGYVDQDGKKNRGRIQKFYEGAAGKAAQVMVGEKEGFAANMLKEISQEPWYVQAIAAKLLPSLEKASEGLGKASEGAPIAVYDPGIARK